MRDALCNDAARLEGDSSLASRLPTQLAEPNPSIAVTVPGAKNKKKERKNKETKTRKKITRTKQKRLHQREPGLREENMQRKPKRRRVLCARVYTASMFLDGLLRRAAARHDGKETRKNASGRRLWSFLSSESQNAAPPLAALKAESVSTTSPADHPAVLAESTLGLAQKRQLEPRQQTNKKKNTQR